MMETQGTTIIGLVWLRRRNHFQPYRRTQNPVGVILRVGSSPTSGTNKIKEEILKIKFFGRSLNGALYSVNFFTFNTGFM